MLPAAPSPSPIVSSKTGTVHAGTPGGAVVGAGVDGGAAVVGAAVVGATVELVLDVGAVVAALVVDDAAAEVVEPPVAGDESLDPVDERDDEHAPRQTSVASSNERCRRVMSPACTIRARHGPHLGGQRGQRALRSTSLRSRWLRMYSLRPSRGGV